MIVQAIPLIQTSIYMGPPRYAVFADDDANLALVFDLLRLRRKTNRLAGLDDRRGRLEEDERFLGDLVAKLLGVVAVVAPDTDDFRGEVHGEEDTVG